MSIGNTKQLTVKQIFRLVDHAELAQLHNSIYSHIPHDRTLTVTELIDQHREYQHALAIMQAITTSPDIATGLHLDMSLFDSTLRIQLPPLEILANTMITNDDSFKTHKEIAIAILSRLMYAYQRKCF